MCCIFTCCGWLIDLVQRLWTFTMSCCISSSVCCLLATGSMSGIALGYNYSLAEYMDLKETNVSIFLKRGVFDDELTELEWRRAGHIPARAYDNKEGIRGIEHEADMLEAGGTTVRSGRRLDDSVVDSGDQNRYEGSLFRLTAKPPVEISTKPQITADDAIHNVALKYSKGTLDSLKAIQNIIDARKAMLQNFGGTTVSPMPTYPFQDAPLYPMGPSMRRGMQYPNPNLNMNEPPVNSARFAVPPQNIGSRENWMPAKFPNLPLMTGDLLDMQSITYPTPITLNKGGRIRPTPSRSTHSGDENELYLTPTRLFTLFTTVQAATNIEVPIPDQNPTIETLKEKLMMENEMPIRKQKPKPEEDYDYDVKGLPVRKRRSVKTDNQDASKVTSNPQENDISKLNGEEINQPLLNTNVQASVGHETQNHDKPIIAPTYDLVSRLISKIKAFFEPAANDRINDASKNIIQENEKNIPTLQGHSVGDKLYLKADVISMEPTVLDFGNHKTSDSVLGYNDKDIIKSTSSMLVNMLLQTTGA